MVGEEGAPKSSWICLLLMYQGALVAMQKHLNCGTCSFLIWERDDGPPDGTRIVHHVTDELHIQQNTIPDGETISRAPFGYPDRFFHDFSSVVRQMPGYTMQSLGTARTPLSHARRLHLSAWQMSHTSSLRQRQSGLRTREGNQPKFIPYLVQGNLVPSLWHDQSRSLAWLQNR